MINILFKKIPEVLKMAIEKLQKSPYANSSPEKKRALQKLMKQLESQTTEFSKLVGNEDLTEQQENSIKELEKIMRGG